MPNVDKQQAKLETEHLRGDIEQRTARGGLITMGAQLGKSLSDLASTVVLARLLVPDDFGLLGMVVAITGFLSLFKDLGLSMATIQREEITHAQVSNLFWINVAVSILLVGITASLAPVLAWFYDDPRLIAITLALAVGFLFSGLSVQHLAILKRRLRFGALAAAQVAALLGSVAIGIWMALNGFGYWALVAKSLCAVLLTAATSWLLCRWRPSLPSRGAGMRELLSFGGNLTGFSLINYFARNLDDILIGRFTDAHQLGLYQKAYQLFMTPLKQLNRPLSAVAIPVLSRLVEQPQRYRETYLRIVEKILLVSMPLAVFMFMTADWLVVLLLGNQWLEAAPVLKALSIVAFTQPLNNSSGWLFISQDRTHDMMHWGVISSLIAMVAFLIGLPWGVIGVAIAYSTSGVLIRAPLNLWFVCKEGPIQQGDIYQMAWPFTLPAIVVGIALVGVRGFWQFDSAITGLLTAIGVSGTIALAVLLLLPAGRGALRDLQRLLQDLKSHS